jgi:hypothetical protein
MKKSRILLGIGTLVLACAATFAAKSNKRFTNITGHLPGIQNSGSESVNLTNSKFTFSSNFGANKTVMLATASGGKIATLLTNAAGTHVVYFK